MLSTTLRDAHRAALTALARRMKWRFARCDAGSPGHSRSSAAWPPSCAVRVRHTGWRCR